MELTVAPVGRDGDLAVGRRFDSVQRPSPNKGAILSSRQMTPLRGGDFTGPL